MCNASLTSLLRYRRAHEASFLVVQACDNLMEVGPDYMGDVGKVQIVAACLL